MVHISYMSNDDAFVCMQVYVCIWVVACLIRVCHAAQGQRPNALTHHCARLQHAATRCRTLQHTATHCITWQHTTTYRNSVQHARSMRRHHSCVTHTFLTYMCAYDTTRAWCIHVMQGADCTAHTQMCVMTHSCASQDPFPRVTRLIHVCDTTHSYDV